MPPIRSAAFPGPGAPIAPIVVVPNTCLERQSAGVPARTSRQSGLDGDLFKACCQVSRVAIYLLVYSVEDQTVIVTVIAVGKRDRNEIYDVAISRVQDSQEP